MFLVIFFNYSIFPFLRVSSSLEFRPSVWVLLWLERHEGLAAAANFLHLTFKVLSFVVQVNVKPFMRHKALPVLFYLLPVNLFQEWLLNCLFKPVEKTKKLFYRFLKQVVNLSCYLYVHKMKIIDTIDWSF